MSEAEAAIQAALSAMGTTHPLFLIRRARCGCRLGAVMRTALAGYVVAGRRQGVSTGMRGMERFRAWYVQSLEQPHGPEWWGCKHAEGVLPLDELLTAARDTFWRSRTFVVEDC